MIELKQIKENKDGSADYEFNYDKAFEDFYKKETGAKVIKKANVGKFILKMIEETFLDKPTRKVK